MPRLKAVDPETAGGRTRELLDATRARFGGVPNLIRTFANSPAVLQGYLGFAGGLADGSLSPRLREQIALVVSEASDCDYCRAAHSAAGRAAGLTEDELVASRQGRSADPGEAAALRFARELVGKEGWVTDEDLAHVRAAGHGDGEIAEIIANVALTLFTNYFNHVASTDVDFPRVEALPATV